jgi:hypothetical protein
MEAEWLLRDGESSDSYLGLIGKGGFGEVHKVRVQNDLADLISSARRPLVRYRHNLGFVFLDALTLVFCQKTCPAVRADQRGRY